MDNLYFIENQGCDDTTYGIVNVPDIMFPWFKRFIENLNKNSTYGCQPKTHVYKISMDDLRLATDEDDGQDRLYLDDKVYAFKEGHAYSYRDWEAII